MQNKALSIRPFIGSQNFEVSQNFYRDLGFEEVTISESLSLFKTGKIGFYLQDAYVTDWINNTMLFIEVTNVIEFWDQLSSLNLTEKYKTVKLVPIKIETWGREFFVHDPSGVLLHFGEFF